MKTTIVTYRPKQEMDVPLAWKKAAGILRGRKPSPLKELKAMRREWEIRIKKLARRSRA